MPALPYVASADLAGTCQTFVIPSHPHAGKPGGEIRTFTYSKVMAWVALDRAVKSQENRKTASSSPAKGIRLAG
jgi:hypothetical protein